MQVVALLVCLATSVVTAELIPGGVILRSHALRTLTAANNNGFVKQFLISEKTNMTTTYDMKTAEERISVPKFHVPIRWKDTLRMLARRFVFGCWRSCSTESLGAIFTSMKLHKTPTELFETSKFYSWARLLIRKRSEDFPEVFLTIIKPYLNDEDLAKFLLTGLERDGTQHFTRKVLRRLLQNDWKTKSAQEVFMLLKPKDQTEAAFAAWSAFPCWAEFIKSKNTETMKTASKIFQEFYNDDAQMANALIAGRDVDHLMKDFANHVLQHMMKNNWKGKTVQERFQLFKPKDQTTNGFVEWPAFVDWTDTIDLNDAKSLEIARNTLLDYSNDDWVANALVAQLGVGRANNAAKTLLESLLENEWKNMDPDEVFTLLKLNESVANDIFSRPAFQIWYDYVKEIQVWFKAIVTMTKVLNKYYGEIQLAGALSKRQDQQLDVHERYKTLFNNFMSNNIKDLKRRPPDF